MYKLIIFAMMTFGPFAMANPGYFRSADLHDNQLVFTAEGDLWLTDLNQGMAKRLTTHAAEEKGAAFSADGSMIAYAANYEGATEVYVIPSKGGVAKRVSFEHARVAVQGWTPEGEVLYSSNSRLGVPGSWSLLKVNPVTLQTQQLPLADAIEGTVDESGENLYFVRFGLQVSTDNVRSYRGGAQGKLWHYVLGSEQEATQLLPEHSGSIRAPMVAAGQIYFISDASGTDNIWMLSAADGSAKQLTSFDDFEVRDAQLSGDQIVFQHGADIKRLSLKSGEVDAIQIDLVSDYPHIRSHWENKPLKFLNSAKLAANDKKVVLTARGRVAVAGINESRLVEVDTGDKNRSRSAILSKDGQSVYAISDRSGEYEIWRFAADGSDDAEQLTDDGEALRWRLNLSPDGQWIAHDDNQGRLFLLDLSSGKNKEILSNNVGLGPFADIAWSPDSAYLAVTRNHVDDLRRRVMLYAVKSGQSQVLTSDKYESYAPTFSHDGDWLYFLSDRNFVASPGNPWGDRNTGSNFDRRTEVFAYALNSDANFPFQVPDELQAAKQSDSKDDNEEKGVKTEVEWKNLTQRLWQVPIESGNYGQLAVNDKLMFISDRVNEPNQKPMIKSLKLEHGAKPEQFTGGVVGFELSQDGKNILVFKEGADNANMFIVPAAAKFPKETKGTQLVTQSWQLLIEPQDEWQQMFLDTWLMHRDSFFDETMRGLDWVAIKHKYEPLLSRVTDRYELNDVFAQMIGELNVLHSQVRGGDVAIDADSPKAASLGAVLKAHDKGVVISRIYQHDPELPGMAAPLAKPGVDAQNGDIIIAVNGQPVDQPATLNQHIRNQVGKQVLLQLKRGKKTHKTVVVPVSTRDDARLRYQHWVSSRKQAVQQSDAAIGYLHLQAMGANDFANFAREFYAHFDKKALIIDVRRNRGGNIDSMILEKLLRKNWAFWQTTRGVKFGNMQQTFNGHLVVLADQFTYSDGETFTAGIKAMELGTVIGKQTAGAGVWLSGRNRVVDNGISRVAEYPVYDTDGHWVVEGRGVSPHIEVDNMPYATFKGKDAQLERAISYLQQKLKDEPIVVPEAQPFPARDVPARDVN
ncbi:S41 family peptidase [Marinicella sp. S1101]|uniref:S41 family peptidase n=1 Tax=Marinicella marina TaxID=2996016 RepID=UPI002260902D|nr:S41 family peptidase [Marinicella marina]MCX7553983.1 S41 family peptidase [Marinicella marina]MDJ1140476.1 S41 family peptidase [Marinicella marina]